MRSVNLLPRESETSTKRPGLLPVLVGVGCLAAVTLAAAGMAMSASSEASEHRADLELTQAAIARLPVGDREPAAPELATERSSRVSALRTALATRVPVDSVLRELSYVVPEDVWLTGFTVTIPTDAAAAAPSAQDAVASTVTVKGATYSQAAIARFVARLAALRSLSDARLTESALVESDASTDGAKTQPKKPRKAVVTFTVTAALADGASS